MKSFIYPFLGKTGKISATEFRHLVFGNQPLRGFRSSTIDAYIAELSGNTGWITFEQFKQFMNAETQNFANPLILTELKQAFSEVDTNKDGFISPEEARQGIILAGERISGVSFEKIAQNFDDNGDGQLSLQEFLSNIKKLFS
jgi:Ca2+-binding EF-hand superfamily protein